MSDVNTRAAMRGADILVQTLARAGVERLYALSGNHVMSIFDACIDARLPLIHTRHEAAAVHMADAQARLTGRPSVALVTGGPGHANALGALYSALMAESAVLLLSGQSPLGLAGQGAFQEIDQVAIAAPVCKAAWSVRDARSLQADLILALDIVARGRPGPVSLSLPSDLLEALAPAQQDQASLAANQATEHWPTIDSQQQQAERDASIDAAFDWLGAGRYPLMLLGPMMLSAQRRSELHTLEQQLQIPVLALDSPRGVDDPRLGGLVGALAAADRILLVGKRVDFTVRFGAAPVFAESCQFWQIEPDPVELDRAQARLGSRLVRQTRCEPLACVARFAGKARAQATATPAHRSHRDWLQSVRERIAARPPDWALSRRSQPPSAPTEPLHPALIGRVVSEVIAAHPNAVLISDGGEFGQWMQASIDPPRRLINGPAGAIGLALPMALAARAVEPAAPVIALMGDGAFGFHPTEFDTAVRHQLPFVVIIGNDRRWNAEYQLQLKQYGAARLSGCELADTGYEQIAQALGGVGVRVETEAQLRDALALAITSRQPYCLNVRMQGLAAPTVPRI